MTDAIIKLLKDRYFAEGETKWEDIAKRVSWVYPDIFEDIRDMNFIPSSPTLMNGNCPNRRGTLSSCFPMNIEDSIEGIFEAAKECAIVTKFSGGIGIDASKLRSSKEGVKGIGGRNSSGPLPFIKIFDAILNGVSQGGMRRGAGMCLLDIYHPDILQFISSKQSKGEYNCFNFSIKIPNEFYETLKNTPDAVHMVRYKDNTLNELKDNDNKSVTTKQLWECIVASAHYCAEPGIFNSTIATDRCTTTNVDSTVICNPCSEYTSIPYSSCNLASINLSNLVENKEFNWGRLGDLVDKGVIYLNQIIDNNVFPIRKIAEVTYKIRPIGLGVMGLAHMFYKMGVAYNSRKAKDLTTEIIRYITLRGFQKSVELAKIEYSIEIEKNPLRKAVINQGSIGGYEAFDYDIFMKANERFFIEDDFREINIKKLKKDIKEFGIRNSGVTSIAPTGCAEQNTLVISNKGIMRLNELIDIEGSQWQSFDALTVPQETLNQKSTRGFINGKALTKKIRLKSNLFIEATLNHKYRVFDFINQQYIWKQVSELKIGDYIATRIGGYTKATNPLLDFTYRVKANNNKNVIFPKELIPELGEFLGILFANGSVHNRGLRIHYAYEKKDRIKRVCDLAKSLFNIEPKVYEEHTCTSIYINNTGVLRYLKQHKLLKTKSKDNTIPFLIRCSSVETIKAFIKGYWYGDGSVTGNTSYIDTSSFRMAQDLLVVLRALGVHSTIYENRKRSGAYSKSIMYRVYTHKYGSKDCAAHVFKKVRHLTRDKKEFCETIGKEIFFDEIIEIIDSESITLDIEVPINNTYISNSCVSHNTIAIFPGASGGIEPVYGLVYTRNVKKIDENQETASIYTIDNVFEKYVNENFDDITRQRIFKNITENKGSCQNCPDIPESRKKVFVTAHDLTSMEHLDILEASANQVTYSISKTINLPESANKSEIAEVFLEAHKRGIIGVTVYRNNSRENVLVTDEIKEKRNNEIIYTNAPKRPKELPCHIHRITVKGEKWMVFVGLLNNKPYELFTGKIDMINLSKHIKEGFIIKNGSKHYSFKYEDEILIKDICKTFDNDEHEAFARQLSGGLRHGEHPKYVIDQLSKAKGTIVEFSKAIITAMKFYITEGESMGKCECGGRLVFSEGCVKCIDCNVAKCG